MRLAALCRCGRCGGPRRWSFSAGARAGPPVARSARHASMLLALPDRGSPWEPSRDCLPDEIADERLSHPSPMDFLKAHYTAFLH